MHEKDFLNIFKLPEDELRKRVSEANLSLHDGFASLYDGVHPQQFHAHYRKKLLSDLYEISAFVGRDKPLSGVRVLDLGSGTGFLTLHMLSIADFDLTCVDFSEAMLKRQEEKIANLSNRMRVKLVKEDVVSFCNQSDRKFDIVMMSAFLHHVFDIEEILRAVVKMVCDRGAVYIAFEPLKDAKMDKNIYRMHCVIREMDNLIWQSKGKQREAEAYDDQSLADFHTIQGGINPEQITRILEESRFTTRVDTFYVRYDESLAWFGDAVLGARNTFSVLAKRG
jgi:ubiquinone/menaquinone biosynthesis C-methylase UbiE